MPRSIRLSSVAPAPISMSSECAPRQRIDRRSPEAASRRGLMLLLCPRVFSLRPPHRFSLVHHFFKYLFISHGIHRPPEPLVFVGDEFACLDEAIKGFQDQFLAFVDVVKNLIAKDEVSAIDPNFRFAIRTE